MLPAVHVEGPHAIVPPQPSAIEPQSIPAGQLVAGLHAGLPHAFCVPAPPQISPAFGHVEPQLRIPPHPSATWPQLAFAVWQVSGTQVPPSGPPLPPQTLGEPPPPQVCG
jgi:hypothetical protein